MFAVGAVAAFGDAVFTNGFGVRLSPRVGTERGVVGLAGQQTSEHVVDVGPDIEVVAQGTADQREEIRGAFAGSTPPMNNQFFFQEAISKPL